MRITMEKSIKRQTICFPANWLLMVLVATVLPSNGILEWYTSDRSRAEQLWLVCGVMGDVMLCDKERYIHRRQTFYATIHSEKITSSH
jgi:hypothetical protein